MEQIIEKLRPAMVLINRQPLRFDSVTVFMHLKEKYPAMPVLRYALQSDTAIDSLPQVVAMVLQEKEKKAPKIQPLQSYQSAALLRRM
ncbi:MAG: hypothetical protein ACQERN_04995 [Thermodesulfobacteriota bacterium]